LLGAAEAVREGIGVPLPSAEWITHERLRAELRNGLGERELAEAIDIGRHTKPDVWTEGGGDARPGDERLSFAVLLRLHRSRRCPTREEPSRHKNFGRVVLRRPYQMRSSD
jgi:hypothetical protein